MILLPQVSISRDVLDAEVVQGDRQQFLDASRDPNKLIRSPQFAWNIQLLNRSLPVHNGKDHSHRGASG